MQFIVMRFCFLMFLNQTKEEMISYNNMKEGGRKGGGLGGEMGR